MAPAVIVRTMPPTKPSSFGKTGIETIRAICLLINGLLAHRDLLP